MKITVNGHEYDDWSQVPPDLQKALSGLPDADGNGVPDLFEGNLAGIVDSDAASGRKTFTTSTSIEVDGQHYDSLDMVPQNVRDLLGRAVLAHAPEDETRPDQPAAGQVQLNGESVSVDQAAGATAKKGFLSRLLGR